MDAILRRLAHLEASLERLETKESLFYDEGDAVVTLTCSTSGTITLTAANDTLAWTKVGRVVTVTGRLVVDSVNAPVGILTLNNLPYACANGEQYYAGAAVSATGLAALAVTAIVGMVIANTTTLRLEKFSAGGTGNLCGDVQAGTNFMLSATYFAVS